ncbi:hypothetical protein GBAR_LOCUS19522 [Geodia barretti]|uniref:Uncharacterized protein n=1 Tax=Geodia barretti TaxID=519541 RepID=A0AA35X1P2_GEOBA|nr:hypothetical protein GBAR_LOCUS19522 [Geodia barretti]
MKRWETSTFMIYMWKHALEPVGTDVTLAMVGSPCSGGEHCEIENFFATSF